MSIVVDANVLGIVFSKEPGVDYAPVKKWIWERKGRVVIGGTKYRNELKNVHKAVAVINELGKARKVISVNDDDVNRLEQAIRNIVPPRCDDPHLIALIGVSRCPLICSDDSRADEFLTDGALYPWSSFHPKIYRKASHAASLLTDANASAKCFEDASHNPHFEQFIQKHS